MWKTRHYELTHIPSKCKSLFILLLLKQNKIELRLGGYFHLSRCQDWHPKWRAGETECAPHSHAQPPCSGLPSWLVEAAEGKNSIIYPGGLEALLDQTEKNACLSLTLMHSPT